MSTTAVPPTPIALDDAITAVKTAEGTMIAAQNSKQSTSSQLSSAQQADSGSDANLASAAFAYKSSLDVLIASAQQVETGLPAPAPALPADASAHTLGS